MEGERADKREIERGREGETVNDGHKNDSD